MSFQEFLAEQESSDIVRYIEYKAAKDQISVDEAASRSLARLVGQIQGSPIVIITAFRSERTLTANRNLNRELANDLRQLGWGYTPVFGGYLEIIEDAEGQPKKIRTHEESFFVTPNTGQGGDGLLQRVVKLLIKYQQESALVKFPSDDEAFLISSNGEKTPAGKWHADPQLMARDYTRMRKGPPNRQFTFEAAGDDSISTRRTVDSYFKNLNKSS